jgi:hypothetical protein
MDNNNDPARGVLLAVAAAAAATTTAVVLLLASPAGAGPVALPTPTATAAAVPSKLPLPTVSASLPVTVPASSAPVTGKLPTTGVGLPSVTASLPPVSVSAGPVQATLGPVTAALPPGSSALPSAATPTPLGGSGPSVRKGVTAPQVQTGGRVTSPSLGYQSGLDAAHRLDGLSAVFLSLGAGLTPGTAWGLRQSPGAGSSGVVGRQSVAAPSFTQSPPPVTRGLLVLAVLAILALSVVTGEYARGVLLRRRPVR